MLKGIKKYYVGLGIIAVLVIVLLGYVLAQAGSYKKDQDLNERAVAIANDLNTYITKNRAIPDDLSDAVSGDVPSEIKFTKESKKRYKFCVTYRSSSEGSSNPQEVLFNSLYGGNFGTKNYDYKSSYTPSTLYISSYSWSKGDQCETVEPYISSTNYYDRTGTESYDDINSDSSSNIDFVCESDYQYYNLYKDYCVDGEYKPNYSN